MRIKYKDCWPGSACRSHWQPATARAEEAKPVCDRDCLIKLTEVLCRRDREEIGTRAFPSPTKR